jgi:hypothetical protein
LTGERGLTVVFEGVTPAFIGHLDGNEHLVKTGADRIGARRMA